MSKSEKKLNFAQLDIADAVYLTNDWRRTQMIRDVGGPPLEELCDLPVIKLSSTCRVSTAVIQTHLNV